MGTLRQDVNPSPNSARTIAFTADPAARTLIVTDDGSGMSRAELRRYHDLDPRGVLKTGPG